MAMTTYVEGQLCSNLVFGPEVTVTRRGMKSGERGTTLENSECQDLIAFLGWRKFCASTPGFRACSDYSTFNQYVRRVFCGDDSVYALQPPVHENLTSDVIVSWYSDFGIPVTAADKSTNIRTCTIDELQFLKHKFMISEEHGRWIAVADESIISNLLNWQTTTLSRQRQLLLNSLAALRFAYWHGRDRYNYWYRRITNALMSRGLSFTDLLSYDSMGQWIQGAQLTKDLEHHEYIILAGLNDNYTAPHKSE
jgi:hypothetical protein